MAIANTIAQKKKMSGAVHQIYNSALLILQA
jgi:hypothetical protein